MRDGICIYVRACVCACVLARQIGSFFSCFHDKVSLLFGGLFGSLLKLFHYKEGRE